jgi:hypothetical protein
VGADAGLLDCPARGGDPDANTVLRRGVGRDFEVDLAAASNPCEGKATEPLTSIAWLFWHIGSMPGRTAQLDFLGGDHTTESGWTSPYIAVIRSSLLPTRRSGP